MSSHSQQLPSPSPAGPVIVCQGNRVSEWIWRYKTKHQKIPNGLHITSEKMRERRQKKRLVAGEDDTYCLAAKIIFAFLSFRLASLFSALSSHTAFPPNSSSRISSSCFTRSCNRYREIRDSEPFFGSPGTTKGLGLAACSGVGFRG